MVESAVADRREDLGDAEAAGVGGEREQTDQEGDVAELGDQERLEGGGTGLGRLPVVPDEEVRADAHDLPADQEHHQVAGVDDQQHGGGEEGDEGGVGRVAGVVAEVGRGVELYAGGDDGDEDGDQDGEPVEVQRQVDGDRAGGGELGGGVDGPSAALADGDEHREHGGGESREDRERPDEPGGGTACGESGEGADEREEGDESGEGRGGHAVASAFFVLPAFFFVVPAFPPGPSAGVAGLGSPRHRPRRSRGGLRRRRSRRCRGAGRCRRCPGCGGRPGRSRGRCRSRRRRWRW